MYSSLKTMSIIAIIFSVLDAAAAVVTQMIIVPDVQATLATVVTVFLYLTAFILLFIGISLLRLHFDLELAFDSTVNDNAALRKRIEKLEKRFE